MIDIKRILIYCKNLDIQIEDFLFLYIVRAGKLNKEDEELLKLRDEYYERNYHVEDGNIIIQLDWKRRIEILIRKKFIIAYPNWAVPRKDNQMIYNIFFNKLEITERFNEDLYVNDVEDFWDETITMYEPEYITSKVNGQRESIDTVKKKFWELCGYGDKAKLMEILAVTEYYRETHATHKVAFSVFIDEFSEHKKNYVKYINKISSNTNRV